MDDDKSTQQQLAETVILLRHLRGLTQTELAARSGLSDVYVRQIERGERDIGIGALEKLANGLSCDPGELLRSDGRNAISYLVGEAFASASESEKQAIVFMLRQGDGEASERKKALLTLLAQEIGSLAPAPPRATDPSLRSGVRSTPSGRRPTGSTGRPAEDEALEQEAVAGQGQGRAKRPRAKRARKR